MQSIWPEIWYFETFKGVDFQLDSDIIGKNFAKWHLNPWIFCFLSEDRNRESGKKSGIAVLQLFTWAFLFKDNVMFNSWAINCLANTLEWFGFNSFRPMHCSGRPDSKWDLMYQGQVDVDFSSCPVDSTNSIEIVGHSHLSPLQAQTHACAHD